MGAPVPTFTDYSTPCGEIPQSFFQMLVNSIVSYVDAQGHTHCYLNLIYQSAYCDSMGHECIDCNNNSLDPERILVNNLFALDECGRLGLKVLLNLGEQ